jgi:hypothetical protein
MHIHLQCADDQTLARLGVSEQAIFEVVERVIGAAGTRLVVLLTLTHAPGWAATCHSSMFTPDDLPDEACTSDMPERFRLIQVRIGAHPYPLTTVDDYGWCWYFASFLDHLAVVVLHEVHHLCQPDVARHRANCEWEANYEAWWRTREMGFQVGARAPARREAWHG